MNSDADIIRLILAGVVEAIRLVGDWMATGRRPSPERVEAVWSQLEQAKAKLETDAAARERWGDES